MRNGFRVYDSDTHVNPAAEVLDRYVDPDFRPRLAELEPYRLPVGQAVDGNERAAQLSRRHQILPPGSGRESAARDVYRTRDPVDGNEDAAARASRTTRPPTASSTWTTKARMFIS